jgi:PEGA domain
MAQHWFAPHTLPRSGGRLAIVALGIALALVAGGCVQRRLTIRSNPPGARVYVGDEEIGTTPVSTDFVYYGTRKIRLVKDGFETLVVNQPIPAPWYQIPPVDFVSENLVPGEIRDERVVNYQLVPLQEVPTPQLLSRAEQLRAAGAAQPIAIVTPAAPATALPGAAAPVIVPAPAAVPATSPQPLPEPGQGGPIFTPPQYLPPG